MKTKIILIAVITIIGISLFSAFKQSEGSKKLVIVRVSEKLYGFKNQELLPQITISENGKIVKTISLEATDDKSFNKNFETISKVISDYYQNGFNLVEANTIARGVLYSPEFEYILVKE